MKFRSEDFLLYFILSYRIYIVYFIFCILYFVLCIFWDKKETYFIITSSRDTSSESYFILSPVRFVRCIELTKYCCRCRCDRCVSRELSSKERKMHLHHVIFTDKCEL